MQEPIMNKGWEIKIVTGDISHYSRHPHQDSVVQDS